MLCLPDVLNSSILDVFQNDPYPGRLCFKMILIRLCFKMILIRCFKMIRVPHLPWGNMFIWYACFLDLGTLFVGRVHVFWTWPDFFVDLGAQKMSGTCLCVFWTLWEYFFLDLHVFVLDLGTFFRPPN